MAVKISREISFITLQNAWLTTKTGKVYIQNQNMIQYELDTITEINKKN